MNRLPADMCSHLLTELSADPRCATRAKDNIIYIRVEFIDSSEKE